MINKQIELIECPRDAIQGLSGVISTDKKIAYINSLIESALFTCIDFGSFVSPKAVPQMQDSASVLEGLVKSNDTKLLAIIANERGAEAALSFHKLDFLGFPFSISETFQLRNANATIAHSFRRVQYIADMLARQSQELVIYISMAFGNPYGDHWDSDVVLEWVEKLAALGVKRFSIADTTSMAVPKQIHTLFKLLLAEFPELEFSAHFHSRTEDALSKVTAAHEAGCQRFEGALLGFGGCPFAQDDLVGNVPTELLLDYFKGIKSKEIHKLLEGFQELIRVENEI